MKRSLRDRKRKESAAAAVLLAIAMFFGSLGVCGAGVYAEETQSVSETEEGTSVSDSVSETASEEDTLYLNPPTDAGVGDSDEITEPSTVVTEEESTTGSTEGMTEVEETGTEQTTEETSNEPEGTVESESEGEVETETESESESKSEVATETETESESETGNDIEIVELEDVPSGESVYALRADEFNFEGEVFSLEADEHFIIGEEGSAVLGAHEVPDNSCGFAQYFTMSAGSSILIRNTGNLFHLMVYGSSDSKDEAAVEFVKADGSVVDSWTLCSADTIELHKLQNIACEGESDCYLKVTEGTARIYCVAICGATTVERAAPRRAARAMYTPTQIGNGTIPVFLDMNYSANVNQAAVSIRKAGESDWTYFSSVWGDFVPYYALEPNSTYEVCYAMATMHNTPYAKGIIATGESEVTDFTLTEYNTTTKKTKDPVLYAADDESSPCYTMGLGEGNWLDLGYYTRYSNTSGITLAGNVPSDAVINLYLEDGALIPYGWLFSGRNENHFYLYGKRTVRYSVEGTGYETATGSIVMNQAGNSFSSYAEDEGHEAESVVQTGSNMLTFDLKVSQPEEKRVVNVTISDSVNSDAVINVYDDQDMEIPVVEGSGSNPAVFAVEVPDTGEKLYRYEISAEGYATFSGEFAVTSTRMLKPATDVEEAGSAVNLLFDSARYRIEVSLIPQVRVNQSDLNVIPEESLNGKDHIDEAYRDYSEYYRLDLSPAINSNHFNAESFETRSKMMLTNDAQSDWEIIGYYCNTKKEDDTYNHDTTLRVINRMNCDLYDVSYDQGALTMKQLVGIEERVAEKYRDDAEWQLLFGEDYSYYNYLVYWFRQNDEKYSNITTLEELSESDFGRIIYPGPELDVWYAYTGSGYREFGMTREELSEAQTAGKVYESAVNPSDYAPYEVDERLDELIKAMAYRCNYSFALDRDYVKNSGEYKEGNNLYVTYPKYEDGVSLDFITEQLGASILGAGSTLRLDNMGHRVEINGLYSNVFQERDYRVEFGLYLSPLGELQIQKVSAEDGSPLEGVSFKLKDESGEEKSYTTDENGMITIEQLRCGTYYLNEEKTLTGYIPVEKTYRLTVAASTEGAKIKVEEKIDSGYAESGDFQDDLLTVSNAKYQGTLNLAKTDAVTGRVLTGSEAVFVLEKDNAKLHFYYDEEKQSYSYTASADGVTNLKTVKGRLTLTGIPEGSYVLKEAEAPEGYIKDTKIYSLIVSAPNTSSDKADVALYLGRQKMTAGKDGCYHISNKSETTEIEIRKVWSKDVKADAVTAVLEGRTKSGSVDFGAMDIFKNNPNVSKGISTGQLYVEIARSGLQKSWSATVKGLPAYLNGEAITYTVTAERYKNENSWNLAKSGQKLTVNGLRCLVTIEQTADGWTITNEVEEETETPSETETETETPSETETETETPSETESGSETASGTESPSETETPTDSSKPTEPDRRTEEENEGEDEREEDSGYEPVPAVTSKKADPVTPDVIGQEETTEEQTEGRTADILGSVAGAATGDMQNPESWMGLMLIQAGVIWLLLSRRRADNQ